MPTRLAKPWATGGIRPQQGPLFAPALKLWDSCGAYSSTSDDVDHREYDYPYDVDKMPIQRKYFQALAVLARYFAQKRKRHDDRDSDQAHRNVKRVQPDKRVVGGSEKIGADG